MFDPYVLLIAAIIIDGGVILGVVWLAWCFITNGRPYFNDKRRK